MEIDRLICRLCREDGANFFIFGEDSKLSIYIESCCSLQVIKNDGLPDKICFKCKEKLESFMEFRSACLESDSVLRQLNNNVNEGLASEDLHSTDYDICVVQDDGLNIKQALSPENSIYEDGETTYEVYPIEFSNVTSGKESSSVSKKKISESGKILPCGECNKTFTVKSKLAEHKRYHSRLIPCEICKKQVREYYLKRHIEVVHNADSETSPVPCTVCKKSFGPTRLRRHMRDYHKIKTPPVKNVRDKMTVFICDYCSKMFKAKNKLAEHIRHHLARLVPCHICKKLVKEHYLKQHFNHVHDRDSEMKLVPCKICNKLYRPIRLPRHMRYMHSGKSTVDSSDATTYSCGHCCKNFSTDKLLSVHMKIHLDPAVPCKICNRNVKETNLQDHIERYHSSMTGDKEYIFKCEYCDRSFAESNKLAEHMKHHLEPLVPCYICEKFFNKRTLKRHIKYVHREQSSKETVACHICKKIFSKMYIAKHLKRVHDIKPTPPKEALYKCEHCKKKFHDKATYKEHLINHVKPVSCHICGKKLKKHYLSQHIRNVHENASQPKEYSVCSVCGKVVTAKFLPEHIKMHNESETFTCDYCDKNFTNKIKLKHHIIRHTEHSLVSCHICGKVVKKIYLKRHINFVHHVQTMVSCTICDQVLTRVALKTHVQLHTGERNFQCDICSKKFPTNNRLHMHMRTHSGQKPYKCNYCDSMFALPKYRKEHEKLHTREIIYSCPCCDKTYAQLSSMRSHIKRNHKDKYYEEMCLPYRKNIIDGDFSANASTKVENNF